MRTSRPVVALLLVLCLVGAACGSGGGGDADADQSLEVVDPDPAEGGERSTGVAVEPTAAFLAQVAQRSEAADRYRVTAHLTMRLVAGFDRFTINPDRPVLTMEVADGAASGRFDLGAMLDSTIGQAPPAVRNSYFEAQQTHGAFVMEMAGDESVSYLRAPFFGWMAEQAAPGDDTLAPLADLGDRWGRIDLTAIGVDLAPSELGSLFGGTDVGNPAEIRQLLVSVSDDVADLGADVIDGDPVHGLEAVVTIGDLIEAQGMSRDDLLALGDPGGDPATRAIVEGLFDTDVPLGVWVDGDGLLRRVEFELDLGDLITAAAQQTGEELPPGGITFEMTMRLDFGDYGDPDIVVEMPDAAEAVDLTPWIRGLLDRGLVAA